MPSDIEKHRELLDGLKAAMGKNDGAFEQAVTSAFEHVFEHLGRLNSHVSLGEGANEDRPLEDGESATLR
ncbi:hypothetical protein [Methylobacterium sp. J-070]|uniref:hypothetical protein n=1 Tax=Methylobacterium sp. J-070 TaxID=2836650 RepID=UPI001FB88563|nr:hypothetical protein [Methylobacterium sp. J-070]MCJ2050088.1 hypothetical protein [Methylobacterium sp. J-070]